MFKKMLACTLVAGLASLAGCSGTATTGTGGGSEKNDQFSFNGWKLPIDVKQGSATNTDIEIKRGKDFSEAVTFKIEDSKKGLTFDPAEPKIDSSTNKVNVKIMADKKADIGDHTVTVTGTPGKAGKTAQATFTVKVKAE